MKLLTALFATLFLFTTPAWAGGWEYKVVYLPVSADLHHVKGKRPIPDGYAVFDLRDVGGGAKENITHANILNSLAEAGWEVIAITGSAGGSNVVYLRRPKPD